MAKTIYVEMRSGEKWEDVVGAFIQWCRDQKQVMNGGCHEGDEQNPADGNRYAPISLPDHKVHLVAFLKEWAALNGRKIA